MGRIRHVAESLIIMAITTNTVSARNFQVRKAFISAQLPGSHA
jgi:hypothetical protein